MKYRVGGAVHASTYIGEFEASTPEQAIEMAYEEAGISLCHECSREVSDPEVVSLWAEDDDGNTTSEPSDHDRIVALQAEVAALKAAAEPVEGRWVKVEATAHWLLSRGHKEASVDLCHQWNDPGQPGDGTCRVIVPAPDGDSSEGE